MNFEEFNIDQCSFTPINQGLGLIKEEEIEENVNLDQINWNTYKFKAPTPPKQILKVATLSWINLLSMFIDIVTISFIYAFSLLLIIFLSPLHISTLISMQTFQLLMGAIFVIYFILYFIVLGGVATLGEGATKISLRQKDNEKVSVARLLVRTTINLISPFLLFLPLLFDLPAKYSKTYLISLKD